RYRQIDDPAEFELSRRLLRPCDRGNSQRKQNNNKHSSLHHRSSPCSLLGCTLIIAVGPQSCASTSPAVATHAGARRVPEKLFGLPTRLERVLRQSWRKARPASAGRRSSSPRPPARSRR